MNNNSVTADQIKEIITNCLDRETTSDNVKFLVELPMTKEEYETFMNFIDNK
jgi:hypothetical protein